MANDELARQQHLRSPLGPRINVMVTHVIAFGPTSAFSR
jgi:hypothetical protein